MAQTSPVLSSINAIMQQKRTLESMLNEPRMKPNCIKLVNDMHRALTKDQRDLRLTDEGVEFMLEMFEYLDIVYERLMQENVESKVHRRIEVGKQSLRRVLHALRIRLDLETALYWSQAQENCKPLFQPDVIDIDGVRAFHVLYEKVAKRVQDANIKPYQRGGEGDHYAFGFGRSKKSKDDAQARQREERPLPGTDPRDTGPWHKRTLRVYICASAADMSPELKELHATVLPQFRQACAKRGVALVEIDFQPPTSDPFKWPSDDAELGARLGEVEMADVFIGILGSEIGRILTEPVSTEMRVQFPWLKPFTKPGLTTSVQELEITAAIFKPAAAVFSPLFYFRDPSFKPKTPAALLHEKKVNEFHARIFEREADCTIRRNTRAAPSCCRMILRDLMNVLDSIFPEDQVPSRLWWQRCTHDAMGNQLIKLVVDRKEERAKLERLFFYPSKAKPVAISTDNDPIQRYANQPKVPLALVGPAGSGKSTVVAKSIVDFVDRTSGDGKSTLVVHFVESSREFVGLADTVRRVTAELIQSCSLCHREIPLKDGEVISQFAQVVAESAFSIEGRLVIVIDGIDHISLSDNDSTESIIEWLYSIPLPDNVGILVTCSAEHPTAREINKRGAPVLALGNFTEEQRLECISRYLRARGKRITADAIKYICRFEHTCNPFILHLILARIQSRAVGEDLGDLIRRACEPTNIPDALSSWVDDITKVFTERDRGLLVREALSYLSISRCGIFENELSDLVRGDCFSMTALLKALSPMLIDAGGILHLCSQRLRDWISHAYSLAPDSLSSHRGSNSRTKTISPRHVTVGATGKSMLLEFNARLGLYFCSRTMASPLGHLNLRRAVWHLGEGRRTAELHRAVINPSRMHILCHEASGHEAYKAIRTLALATNKRMFKEGLAEINSVFETVLRQFEKNSKKTASTAQGTLAHTETVAPASVLASATATAPVLATQFLRYGHFMVQAGLRDRGLFWIRRAIRFFADKEVRATHAHSLLDALLCITRHMPFNSKQGGLSKSLTLSNILKAGLSTSLLPDPGMGRTGSQLASSTTLPTSDAVDRIGRMDLSSSRVISQASTGTLGDSLEFEDDPFPASPSEPSDIDDDDDHDGDDDDPGFLASTDGAEGEREGDVELSRDDGVVMSGRRPGDVRDKKGTMKPPAKLKKSSSTPSIGGVNVLRRHRSKTKLGVGIPTPSSTGQFPPLQRHLTAMTDLKTMDKGEMIHAVRDILDSPTLSNHWRRGVGYLILALEFENANKIDAAQSCMEEASTSIYRTVPEWHPLVRIVSELQQRMKEQQQPPLPHFHSGLF